jgi:hypothetical protein
MPGLVRTVRPTKSTERIIQEALPHIMRPLPIMEKAAHELRVHHRCIIGIIYHYSEAYPRPLWALSLVVNIITMLFMQAGIYDLANPDDGLCPTYTTAATCLRDKSSLSSSQSKYIWDPSHETRRDPFALSVMTSLSLFLWLWHLAFLQLPL